MVLERIDDQFGACLRLNRPESLNALTPELFLALRGAIDDIAANADKIRSVRLSGAGRAFCAGFDLKSGRAQQSEAPYSELPRHFNANTIKSLAALEMPVIACVQGYCFTGGLELALGADFIIAAESAVFADTHGKYGLNAAWGLTQRLPRRIGPAYAKEIMLTGRRIGAAEALRIGLVNRVVPDDQLEAAGAEIAEQIAGNVAATIHRAKKLIDGGAGMDLDAALDYELAHHPGTVVSVAFAENNN